MPKEVGRIQALWRYPVKSLRGEHLDEAQLTSNGLAGDRAYGLLDAATGRVMSAKRWARLLELGARYPFGPERPPQLVLPDGTAVAIERAAATVSQFLNHQVALVPAGSDTMASYEMAIQTVDDVEAGVDQLAVDTAEVPCPPGSFFDAAPVHLLTDATLGALQALHPAGRFEARRFRPNLLLHTSATPHFVESEWDGRLLAIGQDASIEVLMGTIRCVMTTLPQDDLPRDAAVLRTVAQHAGGNAGVYARVVQPGRIRVGDVVTLL
ncbi:MAG TPA: MOSC N-terminal beta barrel domain-containing protein [Candidatus Acidoferrales bacterium]|nr:MOSC N-terminal beta barrel domain-containing protein [Candidatus Acidoferrales bacterium]